MNHYTKRRKYKKKRTIKKRQITKKRRQRQCMKGGEIILPPYMQQLLSPGKNIYYGLNDFINIYHPNSTSGMRQHVLSILDYNFPQNQYTVDFINSRGNGLCFYNSLYIFHYLTHQDENIVPIDEFVDILKMLTEDYIRNNPETHDNADILIADLYNPDSPDVNFISTVASSYLNANIVIINIPQVPKPPYIVKYMLESANAETENIMFLNLTGHMYLIWLEGSNLKRRRSILFSQINETETIFIPN